MKSLVFTAKTALLCLVLTASAGVTGYALDPTDDLSFSTGGMVFGRPGGQPRLMTVKSIEAVLRSRVDLLPLSQARPLAQHLLKLCRQYQFDPAFALAVIEVESRFRVKALSPVGAVGLMQVMPATAQMVAEKRRFAPSWRLRSLSRVKRMLEDPFFNVQVGLAYLAELRDRYPTRSPYVLVAAYNVGPARMDVLLKQKSFRPTGTKKYYDAIRKGVPEFRFFRETPRGSARL